MHRLPDVLCFEEHRQTSTSMFFQKHRPNIASLRKKRDVFHDVFGFGNSIKSPEKSLIIQPKIKLCIAFLCLKYTIQFSNVSCVICVWKRYYIFQYLFNRLKNIANMHREHDVLGFSKHRWKHRGRCFFKYIVQKSHR